MKFNCSCIIIVLLGVSAPALVNPYPAFAQKPFTDYWKMNGDLVAYPYTDSEDPSSEQKILELRSEDGLGLPIWFAKEVHKIVCLEGNCRILDLWLFWDGVGDYLGFNLFEDRPLTKTDHVDFDRQDYEKLHGILADKESVLGRLRQEDLIRPPERDRDSVDGYSGATQLSLTEYLVKDAAYTCHTLWHTVYGPIREEIGKILDGKADNSFLTLLFDQEEPTYKIWAINFIQRNPAYYNSFYPKVMEQIKSGDYLLSKSALDFFSLKKLSQEEFQRIIVAGMEEFPDQRRYELLWKLAELEQVHDETILVLLDKFAHQKINTALLGYIYKLICPENMVNQRVKAQLEAFLEHENLYVRHLTEKLLADLKLPIN